MNCYLYQYPKSLHMKDYKSSRTKVKRLPSRGHYDQETIHSILDDGFMCHVSFYLDEHPFIIPTAYGRSEDQILLHGSSKSRMMRHLASGEPVAICVTHLDALVLARSTFNSSMNYRSVIILGTGRELQEENEKMEALGLITEQIIKGRWDEARQPNANELKATTVISIDISEASAKIRTGPPGDHKDDYELDIWAGIVPLKTTWLAAEDDPVLRPGIRQPKSIRDLHKS